MLPKLRRFDISEELFDDALRQSYWAGVNIGTCKHGSTEMPRKGDHVAYGTDAARISEGVLDAWHASGTASVKGTRHQTEGAADHRRVGWDQCWT